MTSADTIFVLQQLRRYTVAATRVDAQDCAVAEALAHIDQRFPGIRFVDDEQNRIREHMRIFVDGEHVHEVSAKPAAEVHIFGALSGG